MFEQVNLITIHGKRVIRILLQILTKFTTTESIGNWELFKIKMSCYKKYTKVFMGKLIRKYMKTMISTLKSLILINSVKKNSPNGGLSGGQPPAARCAGAKMRGKFQFLGKYFTNSNVQYI